MKRKQVINNKLSNRQRKEDMINRMWGTNKLQYKYINTMGGYVITFGGENNFIDNALAIRFNINMNEYKELTKKFCCFEHMGISYYESIEQIELLLITIKMLGGNV